MLWARRCWMLLRGGMSHDDVLAEEEGALLGFRRDLAALERVHAAGAAASAAFAAPGAAKDLHPAVTMDAVVAESEAADHAQARPVASTASVHVLSGIGEDARRTYTGRQEAPCTA